MISKPLSTEPPICLLLGSLSLFPVQRDLPVGFCMCVIYLCDPMSRLIQTFPQHLTFSYIPSFEVKFSYRLYSCSLCTGKWWSQLNRGGRERERCIDDVSSSLSNQVPHPHDTMIIIMVLGGGSNYLIFCFCLCVFHTPLLSTVIVYVSIYILLYTPSVLCLVHDFFATKLIFFGLCSP